jgi:hypothetical protein
MSQLIKISHEELESLLSKGGVHFYHMKCNGNIKKCFATRCESWMPNRVLPLLDNAIGCTTYYDIKLGQYRAASKRLQVWVEKK